MCGIFAYLSTSTENIEKLKEHGMKSSHRGPDKTKELSIHGENSFVYFLFHRLAINGLNEKSDQPMKLKNNDNLILICNGEIYNYKELAKRYKIELETDSDCEILLHLYTKSNIDRFIHELDGVFSFLIYDTLLSRIVVGHDPFGVRPLYWSHDINLS